MDSNETYRVFLKRLLQGYSPSDLMNFSEQNKTYLDSTHSHPESGLLDYRGILICYLYLVSKREISESEAEQLGRLLELAETDRKLALLMHEVDELTYKDLGYFKPDYLYSFENERARVMEVIIKQPELPSRHTALLMEYYRLARVMVRSGV